MAASISADPSSPTFLLKLTMSICRITGSRSAQKACIMTVTGTRNSTSAAMPTSG